MKPSSALPCLVAAAVLGAALPSSGAAPTRSSSENAAAMLERTVLLELSRHGRLSLVSEAELSAMIDVQGERQVLGCTKKDCLVSLGKAVAADSILFGSVDRVDDAVVLVLTAFDPKTGSARREVVRGERLVDIARGVGPAAATLAGELSRLAPDDQESVLRVLLLAIDVSIEAFPEEPPGMPTEQVATLQWMLGGGVGIASLTPGLLLTSLAITFAGVVPTLFAAFGVASLFALSVSPLCCPGFVLLGAASQVWLGDTLGRSSSGYGVPLVVASLAWFPAVILPLTLSVVALFLVARGPFAAGQDLPPAALSLPLFGVFGSVAGLLLTQLGAMIAYQLLAESEQGADDVELPRSRRPRPQRSWGQPAPRRVAAMAF